MANVQDRGPVVLAVTCLVIVLATLFVLLRLVSRFCIVRRVSSDDYFMIVAWVSVFAVLRFSRSNGSRT